MFRVYEVNCLVNGTLFSEVWIDSHYELKHGASVNDDLILALVGQLHRKRFLPQTVLANGFQFFESDLEQDGKAYRLIWVIPPDQSYLGVRNAYRRSR